jgi:hypothetical protein
MQHKDKHIQDLVTSQERLTKELERLRQEMNSQKGLNGFVIKILNMVENWARHTRTEYQ